MASGKCRVVPPETMFPADSAGVAAARRVCAGCSVTHQCLEYALASRLDQGVWGGTSSRERRRISRDRRATCATSSNRTVQPADQAPAGLPPSSDHQGLDLASPAVLVTFGSRAGAAASKR